MDGGIALYSRTDLYNWKFERVLIRPINCASPDAVAASAGDYPAPSCKNGNGLDLERPKVVQCGGPGGKFVKWVRGTGYGNTPQLAAVLLADAPAGPFTFVSNASGSDDPFRTVAAGVKNYPPGYPARVTRRLCGTADAQSKDLRGHDLTAHADMRVCGTAGARLNLLQGHGLRLPERLGKCVALQTLILTGCSCLTCLPELGEYSALKMLDLEYCRNLVSMPALSGLEQLKSVKGIEHLKPWKDGGYRAFSFASWLEAQIDQGTGLKALQLTQA
eukprot:6222468-Prymnesium_polylepis.1